MSEVIKYQDVQPEEKAPGVTLRDKVTTDAVNIVELTILDGEYPVGAYARNNEVDMVITGLYKQCTIQRQGHEDVTLNMGDSLIIEHGTPYRYTAKFAKIDLIFTPAWYSEQYEQVPLDDTAI